MKWTGLLAVAAALGVIYLARDVATPLLCAFIAAFMVEPLVATLARRTGRTAAVIITIALLAFGAFVILIFLVPRAVSEAVEAARAAHQNISSFKATLQAWLGALPEDIKTQAADALTSYSGKLLSWAAAAVATAFGWIGGVVSAASKAILFFVGFVFLMLDYPLLRPGLLNLLSHLGWDADRVGHFDAFLSEADAIFRSFFRGQILYAAALGLLTAIGLWAVNLPYGLTLGIAVGILSLIPYVGIALGLAVALGISFYSNGAILHLLLTAGVFGVVQLIDAVYLTPKLLGGSVGIHPLLAVVALLAFSQLLGFFGLMLAMPLAAVTLAAFRRLLAR